jgi:hypothetical protein
MRNARFFDDLAKECPTIFREGSLRVWSDCPPGWESLVRELCLQLDAYAREKNPELIVDQSSRFLGQQLSGVDPSLQLPVHASKERPL